MDGYGGRRYLPYARVVRLRRASVVSQQLMSLIEDLSTRVEEHDVVITEPVESIRQIVEVPAKARSRPTGFTADVEGGDPSGRRKAKTA